ncbi:hypothetical protein TNCV_4892961 [Trichonephila clavipes]|nr:hypothetical protein TNCV_4892961 [Trichonephila clavipes]
MIFLRNHKICSKEHPSSKNAGLTPPAEGLSNISKYTGASPAYRLLPRQSSQPGPHQSQRGLHKLDYSYGPRDRSLGWRGQASVPANLPDHRFQSIPQCTSHICAEMCCGSIMLEPHTSLYGGWNTLQ